MIKYKFTDDRGKVKISYSGIKNEWNEEITTIEKRILSDLRFYRTCGIRKGKLQVFVDNVLYKEEQL